MIYSLSEMSMESSKPLHLGSWGQQMFREVKIYIQKKNTHTPGLQFSFLEINISVSWSRINFPKCSLQFVLQLKPLTPIRLALPDPTPLLPDSNLLIGSVASEPLSVFNEWLCTPQWEEAYGT